MHHEKRQFTNFLYDICCLDNESKYSLHHKISDAKTEAGKICVSQLENYISQKYQGKKNRTEEMMGKELAQIYLDQNNNSLLTKILFGKLV